MGVDRTASVNPQLVPEPKGQGELTGNVAGHAIKFVCTSEIVPVKNAIMVPLSTRPFVPPVLTTSVLNRSGPEASPKPASFMVQ